MLLSEAKEILEKNGFTMKVKLNDIIKDKIEKLTIEQGYKFIDFKDRAGYGILRPEDKQNTKDCLVVILTDTGRLTILNGYRKTYVDILQEFVTDQMLKQLMKALLKKAFG